MDRHTCGQASRRAGRSVIREAGKQVVGKVERYRQTYSRAGREVGRQVVGQVER